MDDGARFSGQNAVDILAQMMRHDWGVPDSIEEFMRNVSRRTRIIGWQLLFWDEESFLMAMDAAGLCTVERR